MTGENRLASTIVVAVAVLPLIVEMSSASLTLRSMGDALGWLGAGMLSSSLLLMVRAPMIVRWFGGEERLGRWHHAFGVCSCVVLLAHPVVLASAVLPNSARVWSLLSPVIGFPANALGWAAILGLAVGLIAPLIWHLRHALWRRLHLCLSLAVLLGFAHAFTYRGLSAGFLAAAIPGMLALGWRALRAPMAPWVRESRAE